MTRKEFMWQLEQLLKDLPENDRLDAIAYYEDYFDEAGPENEASVIQELGSPEKVAATIKRDAVNGGNEEAEYTEHGYSDGQEEKQTPAKKEKSSKKFPWVLLIILAVFALPIWGGLLSGVLGVLVGVIAVIFALVLVVAVLVIAGIVGGVAAIAIGIAKMFISPAVGFLGIGLGALLLALGFLCLALFLWIILNAFQAVFRFVVDLIQKLIYKIRGGNRNE